MSMYNVKFILFVFIVAFLSIIAISINTSGSVQKFIEKLSIDLGTMVHGQFEILGERPTIETIYLEHFYTTQDFALCTSTYTDCWTEPNESTHRYPTVKVMIRDGNADCDSANFHVYVTVCKRDRVGACSATNYDRTVELSYANEQSPDKAYCNYSYKGSLLSFDYYEAPGDWGIYANATDGTTGWNSNEPYSQRFRYFELVGFRYPGSGFDVGMGTLSLGAWNNGTGDTGTDPTAWNTGNVEQDVMWNASDFQRQGGGGTLQITGSNYAIDDDKDGTSDAANLEEVYIDNDRLIQVEFPKTNLKICDNFDCTSPSDAKFNIYWHIYIPAGLTSGTYSNDISVENSQA